jgi:voltage-gated potassium channel
MTKQPPRRRLAAGWRLLIFWSLPPLLIAAGTAGYHATERWRWFDAFYLAVTTLTSLGGSYHATSYPGRVLTVALALAGISTIALAASELIGALVTGELRELLRSRRMTRQIDALEQHVIVCGYGHVGQHVCAELLAEGVAVVAVDRRDGVLVRARADGAHAVLGDASADATLRAAGIRRARALVAAAGTDPDNVLITMTARLLHPALPIVSRSEEEATIPKLLRAGATRTASPHTIAGQHMADAVLHPSAAEADLQLREEPVQAGSPLDGQTVGASHLHAPGGPILVAIRRRDGRLMFNPEDQVRVAAGDVLIRLANRASQAAP